MSIKFLASPNHGASRRTAARAWAPSGRAAIAKSKLKTEIAHNSTAVAPVWLDICVLCVVFRERSEYGTPGAQF